MSYPRAATFNGKSDIPIGCIAAASTQPSQIVANEPTTSSSSLVLPLISRFTISVPQPSAKWKFRRFILGQNGFSTVVFPGSSVENAMLVNTTLEGKTISTVDLGTDEFFDLAYYKGTVWVLSSPLEGGVRIRRLDRSGGETDYQSPDKGLFRLGATESGLYGLTRSGLVIPLSDGVVAEDAIQLRSGDVSLPDTALMVGVGRDLIAVIDRVDVNATLVDLSGKKQSVIHLLRPEIEAIKNSYKKKTAGTKIKGLAVQAAAGFNQKLFLMLSGFKAEEGAPLFVVSTSGTIDKVYRVPMKNGAFQDIPESIQINGENLFVLNDAGNVSTYRLGEVNQ